MTSFQAVVLGLVQGITEFLPISSSAHLVLVPWFFKWQDPGLAYDVFLHIGTLLALTIYFFRDIWGLGIAGLQSILERRIGFERERIQFWMIVIATVPSVVAGLLLHDLVETSFRSPLLIAVTLAFVGFLMFFIDGKFPSLRRQEEMSFGEAIMIGIAQACALIPGVSRSGATMTMARRLGFNRETAARFSFLLSFPITFAAATKECFAFFNELPVGFDWTQVLIGCGVSFVSGLMAIHFLLLFVRNAGLAIFFWYRLVLALVIVLWSMIYQV